MKRLAFGGLVLLQPELIDVYAGAIVNAARDEPDGLGSMLESRVLEVDFRLPEQERIADRQQEKLLIIATLEELTRHEIVLREVTEDGLQLVFPAAFRRDLPDAAEPADNTVEFTFNGPVVNIYVTLVVRLARSDRFTRRGAFQSAAQFDADAGGTCTVHLTRSDEGRGALEAEYSAECPGRGALPVRAVRHGTPGAPGHARHGPPGASVPMPGLRYPFQYRAGRSGGQPRQDKHALPGRRDPRSSRGLL